MEASLSDSPARPFADQLPDSLPWGLLAFDGAGVVRRLNRLAATWWGLAEADALGRPLAGLPAGHLPPALRATLTTLTTRTPDDELPAPAEFYLPQADGWLAQTAVRHAAGIVVYWQDITARKRREIEYQTLVDHTPDLLSRWDHDLRLTYANAAYLAHLGRPLAEVRGLTAHELGLDPAEANRLASGLRQVLTDGQPQQLLLRLLVAPAPRELRLVCRLAPERHEGKIASVLSLAQDVSDLERAEQARARVQAQAQALAQDLARTQDELARRATDKYQVLFNSIDEGFALIELLTDEAGQAADYLVREVNPPARQRLSGLRDRTGRRLRELAPALGTSWLALFGRVAASGEAVRLENYLADLDQWYSVHMSRVGGAGSRELALVFDDISARKQAELKRANALRLLEESEVVAGLGSWDYDRATGAFLWSAGMYRLFGAAPGRAVRPGIYLDFALEDDRSAAARVVAGIETGEADFEETLRLRVGEEVKTVRIKAVLLRDKQGRPARVLGVDLDTSQVRRLETENLRMRLTQQQQRIAAVIEAQEEERRRIAESLHDGLGQLLYAIKLQLDRLVPALPTALDPIRREADRLLHEAIRQARTVSHELTPGIVAEFGLRAALDDICRTLQGLPRPRWQCLIHLDDAPPITRPLQVAIYRLTQELTQNVLKHARASRATLEVETLPGWLVLRTEDDGAGFDPALPSAGLGLRTLRDRVALLGGDADLTSAPGQGTQVRVRVPL